MGCDDDYSDRGIKDWRDAHGLASPSAEVCTCGHRREDHMPPGRTECMETPCRCRLYRTTEPPAETQQATKAATGYRCCPHCAEDSIHDVSRDGHDLPCTTCLAARPSADTETLRRVWEEGYRAAQSDAASKPYSDHPARGAWTPTMNPYGAALDAR